LFDEFRDGDTRRGWLTKNRSDEQQLAVGNFELLQREAMTTVMPTRCLHFKSLLVESKVVTIRR
jgi:hypothetical protein